MQEKSEKKEKKELIYQMKGSSFWRKLFRVVIDAVALFITSLPHDDEWERRKRY